MELIALCVLFLERGLNGIELRGMHLRSFEHCYAAELVPRAGTRRDGFLARLPRGSRSGQIPSMIMRAPCRGIRRFDDRDGRNGPRRPDFSLYAVSHCENSNYRETFDELFLRY